jgi:HAE1 family hydrophobic/amphiphilic exporter-1
MRLVDLCIRRPVTTTMLIGFLVVLGLLSYRRMAVDLFPNTEFPVVSVTTTLPGASVEEMESSVTKPIEEAINTIDGIDELRSETHEGLSVVIVFFTFERQREAAAQDVRDKVAAMLARLPPGTSTPIVDKFNMQAVPVLNVVVSGKRDLREVTEIARKQIKEDIETLRGVGSVTVVGGLERAVNIVLDADRLTAYGLSVQQVKAAIQVQNIEIPGGHVDEGGRELTLRTMGRVERARDFSALIVGNAQGRPITIGDVGAVQDAFVEPRTLSRFDGAPALTLIVRKQSGANTVHVIDRIKERLAAVRPALPPDIRVETVRDQSRFIKLSFHEVQLHLVLAGLLVSLTVLLFIANLRATLIAAVAIPTSIIATFTAMDWLGFTLNNMTMLALVLATGIVIDDAVVVLENIFRHMEERGLAAREAASTATREISLAVMATTLSLVVIFLPVAFMQGMVGRFFSSYGITVAVAIMVSLLVSFTLTPMLCSRFLRVARHSDSATRERGIYAALDRGYGQLLRWSLRHRWAIVVLSVATIASTVPLGWILGKDWLPQDDASEFEVVAETPEGYSLARSEETFRSLEARLRTLPHVTHLLTTIGDVTGRLRAGEGPVTKGSVYVALSDLADRDVSQFDLMKQARAIVTREFPDLRASVQSANVFVGGRRQNDVELDLTGPRLSELMTYAQAIVRGVQRTPGFVDVDTTVAARQPELRVHIHREKASDFGIKVHDIASALRTFVGGEPISTYREEEEQYDVWLRAELANRNDPQAIGDLPIATPRGELIRLTNLATLSEARGPAQIDHFMRRRKVTIVANLEGIPLDVAVRRIQAVVAGIGMPPTYRAEFAGRAKSMEETMSNFLLAFALSLLFMYMILAAQFESFTHPITILLALPLSIPFALISLWLLGETLNIYSILGLFMLFGIVKKNGILQIDYTNTLRAQGVARDAAIVQANHVRLRPILMTTVMLVAGMIPIALGQGPGSASRAAMAKVIIGGQVLCLVLTLLVTPVAYSLFDDLAQLRPLARLGAWARAWRPRLTPANGRSRV